VRERGTGLLRPWRIALLAPLATIPITVALRVFLVQTSLCQEIDFPHEAIYECPSLAVAATLIPGVAPIVALLLVRPKSGEERLAVRVAMVLMVVRLIAPAVVIMVDSDPTAIGIFMVATANEYFTANPLISTALWALTLWVASSWYPRWIARRRA
jgi:hypothetical protein